MMTPRYANPHFLPETTRRVSRQEISAGDENEWDGAFQGDVEAIELLNKVIRQSLHVPDILQVDSRGRKRRKTDQRSFSNVDIEEPILFRLLGFSSISLFLRPKPPPPSKKRTFEYEDNYIQAALREHQAHEVAVDAHWVMRESQSLSKPFPSTKQQVFQTQVVLPDLKPVLMTVQRRQPRRATRPPVPRPQLDIYPYSLGSSPPPLEHPVPTNDRIIIDVDFSGSKPARKMKKKRRKGKSNLIERSIPSFWKPKSNWEGKCRGYAMGYPSYLAVFDANEPNTNIKYRRDTMRRAVELDMRT